jgi:hypothetical protein
VNFKIRSHILFTVDQQCIVVVDNEKRTSLIIEYPEAALWSLMIENHDPVKARLMLMSILHKSESETEAFIDHWQKKWEESGIIE